jgi:DNA-binding transcriptional LysR family regulator
VSALIPVATPAFVAEHGMPASPADLQGMPCVALPNEIRSSSWHFRHRLGSSEQVTLSAVYSVNSALMVRLATLRGMGFSILPEGIAAGDINDGTLVRLLPDYSVDDPEMKLSIVYPGRQCLPAKTRFFIDYALERLTKEVNAANNKPDDIYRQSPAAFQSSGANVGVTSGSQTTH